MLFSFQSSVLWHEMKIGFRPYSLSIRQWTINKVWQVRMNGGRGREREVSQLKRAIMSVFSEYPFYFLYTAALQRYSVGMCKSPILDGKFIYFFPRALSI